MKKIFFMFAITGMISFMTSCVKCYHCTSASYPDNYCDNIYNSTELQYYQNACVNAGGTWMQN